MLFETNYKKYKIFNYKKTNNKKFYEPDSDNGNKPWFYEPHNYNGTEPFSLGYKTKQECLIDANIDECNILIKLYTYKLNKLIDFFDVLSELDRTKCIGRTTIIDNKRLDMTYSSSMYLMKRLQTDIKKLKKRREKLINGDLTN